MLSAKINILLVLLHYTNIWQKVRQLCNQNKPLIHQHTHITIIDLFKSHKVQSIESLVMQQLSGWWGIKDSTENLSVVLPLSILAEENEKGNPLTVYVIPCNRQTCEELLVRLRLGSASMMMQVSGWCFAGSGGQCSPFSSSLRGSVLFCSPVVPLLSVSSLLVWLQSSWRPPFVSAHKPSLSKTVQVHVSQSIFRSALSVIAFVVTAHNLSTERRLAASRSIQHVWGIFFCVSSLYNSRSKFSEITQPLLCVYGSWEKRLLLHSCSVQGMVADKI